MKRPTISQAKSLCDALKARAVIVIALSPDGVAGASYGETKLECKQTGFTLDMIVLAIEEGRIPVWATAESEANRIRTDRATEARRLAEEGDWCESCKTTLACCNCDERLDERMTFEEGADD